MIKINQFIIKIYVMIFSFISCNMIGAGSYPFAEIYEFDKKESEIITAINEFKKKNPGYTVPVDTSLIDGRRDGKDHWYHVYFYYKDENEIIKTWVRQSYTGSTSFAFVAINKGLKIGNWKDINKDYSYKENKLQKKKFEILILNRIIKELYKKQ